MCLTLSLYWLCCVRKWLKCSVKHVCCYQWVFPFSHCFSSCCLPKLFTFYCWLWWERNQFIVSQGDQSRWLLKPAFSARSHWCRILITLNCVLSALRLRLCDSACRTAQELVCCKVRAVSPSVSTSQADGLVNAVMELCKTCYCSHSCLSERRRTESYSGIQGCFTVVNNQKKFPVEPFKPKILKHFCPKYPYTLINVSMS